MLDIKSVRESPELVKASEKKRGRDPSSSGSSPETG